VKKVGFTLWRFFTNEPESLEKYLRIGHITCLGNTDSIPFLSQAKSPAKCVNGNLEMALRTPESSIPFAGCMKDGIHHDIGDHEKGKEVMEAANRNSLVIASGASEFPIGGPVGAVAGEIGGFVSLKTEISIKV
jgi:hypothetical protein